MLKYNIKNIMKLRGITHPSAYLLKNGFTKSTAERIAGEKMKAISPTQIEKLCVMLNCLPNDLFCWVAGKDESANENHPLWKIRRQERSSVAELTKEIPVEKIPAFMEKMNEVKEGMRDK